MLYLRLLWMYLIALFTVVFVYPLLHETGHLFAAFLVGAEVVEFSIFPVPRVSVCFDAHNTWGQVAVGMCGMLLPMLCIFHKPKHFISCVGECAIMIANVIAWLLSCIAIVVSKLGADWENEDVLVVVHQCSDGAGFGVFFFCLIALAISIYALLRKQNLRLIISFF